MQLLLLSKQELIFGPMQVDALINQDQNISKDLSLWNQQGSQVLRGQMLVLPIDNTFLYVDPIYIQATQARMPQLKKVVLASGQSPGLYRYLRGSTGAAFERRPATGNGGIERGAAGLRAASHIGFGTGAAAGYAGPEARESPRPPAPLPRTHVAGEMERRRQGTGGHRSPRAAIVRLASWPTSAPWPFRGPHCRQAVAGRGRFAGRRTPRARIFC